MMLRRNFRLQPAPTLRDAVEFLITELQVWPGMLAVSHCLCSDPTVDRGRALNQSAGDTFEPVIAASWPLRTPGTPSRFTIIPGVPADRRPVI